MSVKSALLIVSVAAAAGIALCLWLRTQWVSHPDPRDWFNAFYVLFARNEFAGLLTVLAFSAAALIWIRRGAPVLRLPRSTPNRTLILLALLSFAITAAGTILVFQQYALTADENMADFQARIFLSGHLTATVPAAWQPFVDFIKPTYTSYDPASHTWASQYLPVYALIRAAFMSFNCAWLTNPILAGLSIVLIFAVTHQLWPESRWKPVLAAALLATSPQFLVMSMTGYAMPAHLTLNLLWLWLYLASDKWRFWLTPFVGVAALGLHQPFFHALFVIPFLVNLVWYKRWTAIIFFAAVYLIGIALWYAWWRHFLPGFGDGGAPSAFRVHRLTLLNQSIYVCLLLSWLAFPLVILAFLGFSALNKQAPIPFAAAASCILTFGFYIVVRQDQSHGWGDRYFHGALGCLVIVAVTGWDVLVRQMANRRAVTFVISGLVASLVVQLPLRALQAERFVAPYAAAADAFHRANADLVVFDPTLAWYSADLRRNDPFLENRPVIMTPLRITEAQLAIVKARFPKPLFVTVDGLTELRLSTQHYH